MGIFAGVLGPSFEQFGLLFVGLAHFGVKAAHFADQFVLLFNRIVQTQIAVAFDLEHCAHFFEFLDLDLLGGTLGAQGLALVAAVQVGRFNDFGVLAAGGVLAVHVRVRGAQVAIGAVELHGLEDRALGRVVQVSVALLHYSRAAGGV